MIAPSFEKKMVKQNLRGVAWHAYNSWLLMACGVAFVHMAHVSLELIYLEQLLNGHVIWHKNETNQDGSHASFWIYLEGIRRKQNCISAYARERKRQG